MSDNDIISYIVNEYYQTTNKFITKTKLMKFIYLVDLLNYRKFNEQYTSIDWVYYKFGPYSYKFDELLSESNITFYEDDNEKYDAVLIEPSKNEEILSLIKSKISFDVRILVKTILGDFALKDISEILEYVYFETEPMINANARGESLSFRNCYRAEDYKIKKLDITQDVLEQTKLKYKERLLHARRL